MFVWEQGNSANMYVVADSPLGQSTGTDHCRILLLFSDIFFTR